MVTVENHLPQKRTGAPEGSGVTGTNNPDGQALRRKGGRCAAIADGQDVGHVFFRGRFIKRDADGVRVKHAEIHAVGLRYFYEIGAAPGTQADLERVEEQPAA